MVLFLHARHPDMACRFRRAAEAALDLGIAWIRFGPVGAMDDGFDHVARQAVQRHSVEDRVIGEAQRFHDD
jgi:hypothetical protein